MKRYLGQRIERANDQTLRRLIENIDAKDFQEPTPEAERGPGRPVSEKEFRELAQFCGGDIIGLRR